MINSWDLSDATSVVCTRVIYGTFFSTNNKTSWIMFLRQSVFLTFRPSLLLPTWNLSLLLRIRLRAFHEMFFMISGRGAGNAVFGRGGGNPAWIINMMECNPASLCLAVSPRRSLNVSENVNKKTKPELESAAHSFLPRAGLSHPSPSSMTLACQGGGLRPTPNIWNQLIKDIQWLAWSWGQNWSFDDPSCTIQNFIQSNAL